MNTERIATLREHLSRLARERNIQVEAARQVIDRANRQFDERAIPYQRELNEVLAQQPEPKKVRPRTEPKRVPAPVLSENWSQEVQDLYASFWRQYPVSLWPQEMYDLFERLRRELS